VKKVCEVCERNSAYAVCDECGKSVCFNCFQFQNHLKICSSCLLEPQTTQNQRSGQPHSKGGFQGTKPGVRHADIPHLQTAEQDPGGVSTQRRGKFLKNSWLVVPILSGFVIVLLYLDQSISRKALEASRKLQSEVNSVAGSVERRVAQLGPVLSKTPGTKPSEEVAAVKTLAQHLRKQDRFPILSNNLRSKKNPRGEGLILYSPEPSRGRGRPVWIVLDGQAYSLTDAAREVTPNLSTVQEVPASLWKRTGLERDKPLNQLQTILSE